MYSEKKKDNIFVLKINNEYYIECVDFEINVSNIIEISKDKFKLLDNLLKSNL